MELQEFKAKLKDLMVGSWVIFYLNSGAEQLFLIKEVSDILEVRSITPSKIGPEVVVSTNILKYISEERLKRLDRIAEMTRLCLVLDRPPVLPDSNLSQALKKASII